MNGKKQTVQQKRYAELVKRLTPKSELSVNLLHAFWVGGVICIVGQAVGDIGRVVLSLSRQDSAAMTSIVLIFLGALLTGLGVYDRIGQYAGGGSIVPITGFANSIVASAMEYRREGLVLGVGARLFQIAGPVLVYGVGASVVVGIAAYFLGV